MTEPSTLDPLPASDLKLNPNVAHPPFPWFIGIPRDWALLDTNPASWQRSAERMVDDRFHGRKLKAAERRAVLDFVEQLVADCQRSGAALSMLQLGRMSTGTVGSAGLHLGWFDSAPDLAGLALVRDVLPRTGTVEEVDTPTGTGLLHRSTVSSVPPGGTTRVRSTVLQLFLPIEGTTWTAVLSAATPHPELERALGELIVAVARSILPTDPEALAEAATADPPEDPDG
ncbi:hypothetical protein ACNTMW_20180 [Planosporangium sp. 12N6]|uniref:hypothetical protein n=1 Tax=Planosporangium spinosum TaxID=3402278 RepID=UPI003CE91AFB